jgi:hypothetical protein
MCRREVEDATTMCPGCRADLALLSGLVKETASLLERAERLRQEGQLAPAVLAYLDVLEVDPANPDARAALGPVLRAIRTPGRESRRSVWMLAGAAIAAAAFAAGYCFPR